jgi:hypothetical protein
MPEWTPYNDIYVDFGEEEDRRLAFGCLAMRTHS